MTDSDCKLAALCIKSYSQPSVQVSKHIWGPCHTLINHVITAHVRMQLYHAVYVELAELAYALKQGVLANESIGQGDNA